MEKSTKELVDYCKKIRNCVIASAEIRSEIRSEKTDKIQWKNVEIELIDR